MERHLLLLKVRVVISAVLFAAFMIVGVVFAIKNMTAHAPTPLVVLLLSSYFVLPRRTLPRKVETLDDASIPRALLDELKKKFVWMRLVYFILAIVVFVVLPTLF